MGTKNLFKKPGTENSVCGDEDIKVALFLQNADGDRYGDLLVEYRKAFANKECRYPSSVSNMMDVMRQQPRKDPSKEEKLSDSHQVESSFIQTGGYACYCCGESTCWFHHCKHKGTLPKEKWSNPEYFEKYQESKDRKVNVEEKKESKKESHTLIIEESHAQLVELDEVAMDVSDDDDLEVKFMF